MRRHLSIVLLLALDCAAAPPPKVNFGVCGAAACPAGFHAASRACNRAACGGACPNETVCTPDRGTWFTQCGVAACPAGFHVASRACNLDACGGQCPNQTVCAKGAASSP